LCKYIVSLIAYNGADIKQNHSASYGFAPHRRHAIRTACHAERPVFDCAGKSQEEDMNAHYGLPKVNKMDLANPITTIEYLDESR